MKRLLLNSHNFSITVSLSGVNPQFVCFFRVCKHAADELTPKYPWEGKVMRKLGPFTIAELRGWKACGRGTGKLSTYIPWHQVRRSDKSSSGRSWIMNWQQIGRQLHLLSDLERIGVAFTTMLPGLEDICEQYPLARDDTQWALSIYDVRHGGKTTQGTLEIADAMSVRHPVLKEGNDSEPWVFSTDIRAVRRKTDNNLQGVPVAIKSLEKLTKRKLQLLRMEQIYWRHQGETPLLITPREYSPLVGNTVFEVLPWALSNLQLPNHFGDLRIESLHGLKYSQAISFIEKRAHVSKHQAQVFYWRGVWAGRIPLDLSAGCKPESPIRFLSEQAFAAQNPVVSGRSVCLN